MAIRQVLLQSVFNTQWPAPPGNSRVVGWQYEDQVRLSIGRALATAATVALMQFTDYAGFTPPFVTVVQAANTPFDAPRAPQFPAAQQQFSAYSGFAPPPPVLAPNTPFDAPQGKKYPASEQQFSAWHSPFFGTQTANFPPPFTPFDAPKAPVYPAAQQQFGAYNGTPTQAPVTPPNIFSPFDTAKAPQIKAAEQQFSDYTGFLPPLPPPTPIVSTPFDAPQAPKTAAAQQQFTAYNSFTPPLPIFAPNSPFDAPQVKPYPTAQQQFSTWHSPFFGTVTANFPPPFTPFDAPQAPKYGAWQQQYAIEYNTGTIVPPAVLILDLPNAPFDTPQVKPYPAFLQMFSADFQPFFGGSPQPVETGEVLGRWGPDETKEERKRRHEAGLIFQHEELPVRSDFAPDPVEHPPHEPQKTADEPANVRGAAPSDLAQVLREYDDPLDDPDIQDLVEWTIMYMQGYHKK